MQGVNTTTPHLPMLNDRFYLDSSVPREPPERSWNRLQRVLIDYPKDKHLLHRQTLWNFHKINRGAFRSQVCSLPDIPFRYKRTFRECRSIGVQTDKSEYDLDRHGKFERTCLILPRIKDPESNNISSPQRSIRPPGPLISPELSRRTSRTSFDSSSKLAERDLCMDLDTETVRKTVDNGTMTDFEPIRRKKKTLRSKKKNTPIISIQSVITDVIMEDKDSHEIETKKSVKFADKMDKSTETYPELEQKESERVPTAGSTSAHSVGSVNIYAENVGSSSQFTLGDPLSVVDFLSKGSVDDGCSSDHDKSSSNKKNGFFGKKRKKFKEINYNEADRIWFEKIAGDKEVVDSSAYDNFARTRPALETVSVLNDKPKTTFTPRIPGEYKLARPNASNKYYPVFSKDGTPVRKVGGGGEGVTPRNSKIAKARQVLAKSF